MRIVAICSAIALGAVSAPAAYAQSNPFLPPQQGLSRVQIQEIVKQEVERARAESGAKGAAETPGTPGAPKPGASGAPSNLPQQAGGAPANAGPATPAPDAVADLLKEGGSFIGCVSNTPIFKDKMGRRAYFTTKELRESNEARRFARCS